MEESWTTDEHFYMTWKFIYEGGEHITIDDKQAYIVSQHSGVLIAIEGSTNGFSSGVGLCYSLGNAEDCSLTSECR
jgi:hypothetical protein